jgi:hypothetical protein
MKSTIDSAKKSKRGRPPVDTEAVNVRLAVTALEVIDNWRRKQDDLPGRPEAIRRLVELGLNVNTPARPVSKPGRRLRAQELATKAIEKMIDPSARPEERAQRRRRLTKGPTEFREDRVDLPKAKGK